MNFGPVPDCCLDLLSQAGDEAILPAGIHLADETGAGRQCFLLLDGSATAEAAGRLLELGPGTFIGSADAAGRPAAPRGVTVRLASRSRVLVIDTARLGGLIAADPAAAARWQIIAGQQAGEQARGPGPPGTHDSPGSQQAGQGNGPGGQEGRP